jgi:serine/threonine protein phosphatase 1
MITEPHICDERICLMGNHEDMLLAALRDPNAMGDWFFNGGVQTLLSYRVASPHRLAGMTYADAHAALVASLPASHRGFLDSLRHTVTFGSYFFVHGGIDPRRPLDDQDANDLLWIRGPFLRSDADFGKIVVHGHTPCEMVEIRPNRINIDTGAFKTGRLTCLVLEGETRRLLQVTAA